MREYLISSVPLRDPQGKWFIDYTASSLFSENSRAISSGSLFGFHGDSQDRENYFGTSRETLVLNILGDEKEEHNRILRGIQGLLARKDFTVLSAPQRSALAVENLVPNPQPTTTTDWTGPTPTIVTAPWDAAKSAYRTVTSGAVHYTFSARVARALKAGETIKVTGKIQYTPHTGRNAYISLHQRSPNLYFGSVVQTALTASWQTFTQTVLLTTDIPAGQADVAYILNSPVPPSGEEMIVGDVIIESLSHSSRYNRSFDVAADLLRTGLFRAVGSGAIDRINEKTARVTWILENLWGFYRSVSEFTTSPLLMASSTMSWDLSASTVDSTAPINSGLLRFKGPISASGGSVQVTDATSGKMIGLRPTVALLSTEYVVVDIATLKANKVTTDSWATTGGTDWTARVELGGEGSFSFDPGAPASGFPDSGWFSYGGTVVAVGGSTATGVDLRFKRSYLS